MKTWIPPTPYRVQRNYSTGGQPQRRYTLGGVGDHMMGEQSPGGMTPFQKALLVENQKLNRPSVALKEQGRLATTGKVTVEGSRAAPAGVLALWVVGVAAYLLLK